MEIRKSLENPIKIQGIDASDLGLSLVLWISSCILMSVLRSLFNISPYEKVLPMWWDLKNFQPVTKAHKCTKC
jgi:hypothetical protein